MFLMMITVLCAFFGFGLMFLTNIYPVTRMIYLDWFGGFLLLLPTIVVFYRMGQAKTYRSTEKVPKWKHLINYLRRDAENIPLIGNRAYLSESFIDIPYLGLMEFLGKDCVYNQGDNKFIWGLENINFSPDPRYFNLTHLLWELGFRNSNDVKEVLSGQNLELMGKVYINMLNYDDNHGVKRLVREFKEYDGELVKFKKTPSHKHISDRVDDILNKREVKKWR